MITSTSYTGYYVLSGFDPITGQWTGTTHYVDNTLLQDGENSDGIENMGEPISVSAASGYTGTESYTGWTYEGCPITYDSVGGSYILTTSNTTIWGPGQATFGVYTYCFARHTLIATPEGDRPVESLSIGDPVVTAEGKCVPVKWIGRQTRHALFAKMSSQLPVLIEAGALGDGLPLHDLYVSPDHALLVDGVLVHALALVNGVSIVQMQGWAHENVEYFHIELENHELILAEGAPAETFVDNVSRRNFDNYPEYVALYGDAPSISELSLPRVKNKRQLSSQTKRRLMTIALERTRTAA